MDHGSQDALNTGTFSGAAGNGDDAGYSELAAASAPHDKRPASKDFVAVFKYKNDVVNGCCVMVRSKIRQ